MPKVVETSVPLKRGDNIRLAAPQYEKCVSNCLGYYDRKGYYFNESRFGLKNYKAIHFRFKRDLDEPNLNIRHSLPKRRVVKKLIRIQPIYNQTLDLNNKSRHEVNYRSNDYVKLDSPHSENSLSSSEEDYSASTTASRKHYRKRVVIKKRRKKRPLKTSRPSSIHHRRTVVVTKKRLLSKSVTANSTLSPVNSISPTLTENIMVTPLPLTINTSSFDTFPTNSTADPLEGQETETTTDSNEVEIFTLPFIEEGTTNPSTSNDKNVPDYEPFFPELSESLDSPVLLLKTTVISSVEYETKTVKQSRLRTYTFVITRVNENEQIVTSTTEVKPQTKTITVTEPRTRFTTLTLLDLGTAETLPFVPLSIDSSSRDTTSHYTDTQEFDGRIFEEARYNLATRIMSNGVEVIVASDKSTLPGEPDIKRILPSSIYKPITLKPSTLSDHMMMLLPQDASNAESLSSSLYPNQFVTKTCLTTFTYLTTYLENGSTTISSHEQVVSNIATEERNSAKIIPTPSVGITLTQHPNLAVGTFLTTYTYLNTILDGEQPLVVTSKHTVTNTVTAPDDYLSLLQPPKKASAVKDTNTYYSTISLQKTLYEGDESKVISTNEVVTQVVITESVPPKATSVMTSYIALDFEDNGHNSLNGYTTTDVVKTYYVTYTYFNTLLENGQTVVKMNVSTSSDIVTEKLFLHPKRTHSHSVINTSPISSIKKIDRIDVIPENLQIHATKTYVTTFTYFTTLLQENKKDTTSTIISSHTREVENIVTESINPSFLDAQYLHSLQNDFKEGTDTVIKLATLHNGQKIEITAINREKIEPTKVLPIEKTQMVETKTSAPIIESSNPNVVTGSTIIFFDEEDHIDSTTKKPTPALASKSIKATKTSTRNGLGSLLSSEIVKKSQIISTQKQTSKSQTKRHTNKQTRVPVVSSKTATAQAATIKPAVPLIRNKTNSLAADPTKKKTATKINKPTPEIPDLLGLGSINVNTLHALKPVINAMAGLITTNLKSNRRNDTLTTTPNPNLDLAAQASSKVTSKVPAPFDIQNRSPIYIPIGDQEDGLEIAESQNVATIHINEWEESKSKPYKDQVVVGKPTHESPLLNGGIPISPGQVITANSDVIVGKPGRIGPRIPSIPLNKEHQDEVPVDMKPPPLHFKTFPKRHNDKFNDPIPNGSNIKERPDAATNQDDYFGPPPPPLPPKIPLRPHNFVRGEKHKLVDRKRIPFPRPNHEVNRIPINYQNIILPVVQDNQPSPQAHLPQIAPLQIPLEAPTLILTKPINEFNIQPSILNEPIVLPEVIERSTGQPLLVNLQPSQVAFVNIPHNRTTALIYGGSTEPHRNGQYFDDPSPYPEPEFSGIENFSNGIPQYASVYDDTQPANQKQVGGVIKVGTDVINNNPPNYPSTISSQIRPSRPLTKIPNNVVAQHDINLKVPPISFGMMHHGDDFNAHIINHGEIKFNPPPASYEVIPHAHNQNIIPQQGIMTHQQHNFIPPQHHEQVPNVHQEGIVTDITVHNKPTNQIGNIRFPNNDVQSVKNPNIPTYHQEPTSDLHHEFSEILLNPPPPNKQIVQIEHQHFLNNHVQRPNQNQHHISNTHHDANGIIFDTSIINRPINEIRNERYPTNDEPPHFLNNQVQRPNRPSQNQHHTSNTHHEASGIIFDASITNRPINEILNERFPTNEPVGPIQRPNIIEQHLQYQNNKHRLRPKPNINNGLMEYLTPPQVNKFALNRPEIPIQLGPAYSIDIPPPTPPPSFVLHSNQPVSHIPINLEPQGDIAVSPSHKQPQIPINLEPEINFVAPSSIPDVTLHSHSEIPPKKPILIPLTPVIISPPKQHDIEDDIVDHKEDDLANEAGEVIQESNPRPLRPGQIPTEILRANASTTEKPVFSFKNNTISFADAHNVNFGIQVAGHDNEISNYQRPAIQEPRPFEVRNPIVRPENQQTNQVNHHEDTFLVHIGNEQSRPFSRPEKHHNRVNLQDHSMFVGNQNVYEYATTKPSQYYFDGLENVNITYGHKLPNLSNKYNPTEIETGNAFVSKNHNNHNSFYTTSRPPSSKVTEKYITSTTLKPNNFYDQITVGSVEVVPIRSKVPHRRPHITSMPVNPPDVTRRPLVKINKYTKGYGSQTEKPFESAITNKKTQPNNSINTTFSFNNNDVVTTEDVSIFVNKFTTEANLITPKLPQNTADSIFESPTSLSSNISTYELDMEVMKPPPPPELATSMQPPPNIEVHSPGAGIHRVPNLNQNRPIYDLEGQASSPSPYVPKPVTEIVPPKTHANEEVMGLNPPPPITTHRPVLHFKANITTHKPIFSLEIDPPTTVRKRPVHPYTFETPTTTVATTRRRRPFTRRPGSRRTTTTPTTTTTTVTTTAKPPVTTRRSPYNWRKHTTVAPISTNVYRNKTTTESALQDISETNNKETGVSLSSSTSVESKPTMEVIIGNPNRNVEIRLPATTPSSENIKNSPSQKDNVDIQIIGSEVSVTSAPTTSTRIHQNLPASTLKSIPTIVSTKPIVTYNTVFTNPSTPVVNHNFTTGVHHAGNEVKVVDDTKNITVTTSISTKRPASTTLVPKETKMIVPTRYITHTKTSTVTITKTTVVKTLGGPPSTMTILVTKTEKSTKVDTVTEIHTLVKPTSIVETITTTISQAPSTLYPPDVPYGSTYQSYPPILPTPTIEQSVVTATAAVPAEIETENNLDEFIIHDTDTPPTSNQNTSVHVPTDNDSIFVVMTDQKHGEVITIPEETEDEAYETQSRDEVPANNEVNRVLLGGILIASPPSLETPDHAIAGRPDKCNPECKASKNELCQKVEGVMRCVCRPGFARMFPDRPCKPTYTYSIKIGLERYGKSKLVFEEALADNTSPEFNQLATVTHEALDRMVMQSDLRDIYHGVHVHSYEPVLNDNGIINNFYLQLSDNTDEQRLKEIFKKYLRNNNYSLGLTELYASKGFLDNLSAEDFDECANPQFHDCSEHAHCFNLPGTYTCSCKEGFSDLSENSLYPGRICSAELIGCEKCHYHGTCYSRGDDQIICECFQWYAGEYCHINLKVLLIALVTLGALLFVLLLVCIILTCARKKPRHAALANGMSFMPQRIANPSGRRATLDRRAMIQDTSSEGSQSDTNTLPYVAKKLKRPPPKGALKKITPVNVDLENGGSSSTFPEQKDRSLTVMIPRAKYHPAPPTSPHLNMESFDKRKSSAASSNEAKLLSYLDAGPSPSKVDVKRKYSNTPSDSYKAGPRKISGGALVSAGFEVSATVGGAMGTMGTIGTIGTTCGTEADRSENATLIQKISADLLSSTGTRSQFTTFRKSLVDNDIDDPLSNWLDITPKVTTTVSEARSYDETTIQPPTKSFRNGYDSKPSSQHQNDEANTMAERDVGSTFLLPHTHLYKPDRGSDISGFDSL